MWVGKLRVEQVCFSFVPGGGQAVQSCPAPTLDGQPFITCNDNVNTDRWDGNAVITLPTSSHPRLAMFGGVAAGKVSKLGGFVDHLGTSVPIAEGVYLTRVGVGLCLYPPPFKLRGDVGVTALPVGGTNAVTINGSFLYTDAFGSDPWSLTLSGSTSVFDRALGDGSLTIRPTGFINFGLHASFNLYRIVSLDGSVLGWLDPPLHSFNLAGRVRGCIKSVCASSDAVVSSVGTAGCLDLGTITYAVLVKNHNWHWYTPWRVHWETRHKHIEAGFGYRWHASSVSLFGGSCDMGRFSAIPSFAGQRRRRRQDGARGAAYRGARAADQGQRASVRRGRDRPARPSHRQPRRRRNRVVARSFARGGQRVRRLDRCAPDQPDRRESGASRRTPAARSARSRRHHSSRRPLSRGRW